MPFAYTNAKVRAWKSDLIDNELIEKLMEAKDSDAVTAMLSQTVYQSDIEKGVIKYKGVSGVEEGLRLNLTHTLQKLLKAAANDSQAQDLVKIVLTKWDIYNLKTVLRGFHAKASEDEIFEQLVPIGTFDEAALRTLAKQPNMKMAISQLIILSGEYAKPLLAGYKSYEKTGNLSDLELMLDKSYFKSVLEQSAVEKEDAQIVHDTMRREIDLVNIMTLVRFSKEMLLDGANVSTYFIKGGRIAVSRFTELLKIKNIKDLVESFKRTPYYDCLKRGYRQYEKTGSLAGIERALEDYSVQKNIALFRADPLTVATIVAFVWAKVNEIINLRIILRGKDVEMPAEDIKGALVLV